MTVESILPSQYLPTIIPSIPSILFHFLLKLELILNPKNIIINLVQLDSKEEKNGVEDEIDEFERNFARQWLERVLSFASRKLREGVEGEEWTKLLDEVASLLSNLSGHGAAGSSTRTYIFPTSTSSSTSSINTLSISIQDTTLLSSSTGFRTWGAATLLSRLITLDLTSFFPVSTVPLKILELGTGTGLVGITSIKMLESMNRVAEVTLTDYETEVMSNLKHNLGLNFIDFTSSTTSKVRVKLQNLDWNQFSSPTSQSSNKIKESEKYQIIIASDVIFEPTHTKLIHSVISNLLQLPTPSFPSPTFHLILPIRHTHSLEHNGFDKVFSSGMKTGDTNGRSSRDLEGNEFRLKYFEKKVEFGTDGFGEARKEDSEYWVYRIGWEKVLENVV